MKITAKLAYSQLKNNRARTVWTLIAIVLSTSLMTAVYSFVVSCNAFALETLGENYGDYEASLIGLLFVPAVILSLIIVCMAVVVILNAFMASAGERREQFGILKSAGATKRQITSTVMYESVLLSAVGIPVGIIVGLFFAFVSIGIANHFLSEINSLTQIMIREISIVLEFVLSWQVIIAAAVISFVAVLFSAWIPARKAAKDTAIDSIRGVGEVNIGKKQMSENRLIQRLFGFEGTLAAKSIKRNKHVFRASTMSLVVGIILFINLGALSEKANQVEKMMFPDVKATIMVDYASSREYVVNENTGKEWGIITAPISSEKANKTTGILRGFGEVDIFGAGSDMHTYCAIVPKEMITSQMMEVHFFGIQQDEYELSAETITVDPENYAVLCEKAGVPVGSNILLNQYSFNNKGRLVDVVPFLFEGQNLRFFKADDSIQEMQIHGILTKENIPNELLPPNTNIVRLIVPQGDMESYIWYSSPANTEGFIDYANTIVDESFPQGVDMDYMEGGFTTRVFLIQDYMKVMNIAIVIARVFLYSFVLLLMLIGLTNVISTMSANVRMRFKEFAVLQSVGMTYEGLKKMLNLEGIFFTLKSLIIGLPIAIVLTYLINIPIRSMFPVPYQLPWLISICCVVVVFAITWITTQYSVSGLTRKSIIETIRSER